MNIKLGAGIAFTSCLTRSERTNTINGKSRSYTLTQQAQKEAWIYAYASTYIRTNMNMQFGHAKFSA